MSIPMLQRLRDKMFTLMTVNIFQPVEKSLLVDQLKSSIDTEQIDGILDELIKEKRVVKEGERYRLTFSYGKSIIPGRGRILRDVERMKYLARVTRQRGGT